MTGAARDLAEQGADIAESAAGRGAAGHHVLAL